MAYTSISVAPHSMLLRRILKFAGRILPNRKLRHLALSKDEEKKAQSFVMHLASENSDYGGSAHPSESGRTTRIDVSRC